MDIALLGLHCRAGSSALLDTLILYATALSLAATVGDVDGLLLSVVLILSERFFAVDTADSLRSPIVAVSMPLPPFTSFGCVLWPPPLLATDDTCTLELEFEPVRSSVAGSSALGAKVFCFS